MAGRLLALLIVVVAAISGFPGITEPPATKAAAAELPYRLEPAMTSSIAPEQAGLVADGSLIVWQDSRSGSPDIYGYDLDDAREFRVARAAGYRTQPAISGSIIIWVSGADPLRRTVEGIDLNTNVPIVVTNQPAEVAAPAIAGNIVVWRQRQSGKWSLRGKNLATGQTFQIADDATNDAHPSVSAPSVVWQAYRDGNWDILRYDLGSGQVEALTTTSDDETNPVISGNQVLFRRFPANGGPPRLVLLDLATRKERVIVSDHLVMQATLRRGIVAWEDWRTGLPDVYAYDVAHDQTFAIARSQRAYDPAVSDRAIAWISRSDLARGRVQALAMITRLPTDPQDPPAVPSPNSVYVPETRHYMSAGFKSYWQAHGGPELFGYPLTEEFTEKDPATGQDVTVQYFERVKMEYRPSAPEGQRVMLARLGAEMTADRHLEPVPAVASTADRTYFAQTGHTIAFGFKKFWEANGGVAIFGYPISEEFTENGRTVQYFERARFEFNPDAKDENGKVTLGLLGQEALQRMGWLPMPPVDTTSLLD